MFSSMRSGNVGTMATALAPAKQRQGRHPLSKEDVGMTHQLMKGAARPELLYALVQDAFGRGGPGARGGCRFPLFEV